MRWEIYDGHDKVVYTAYDEVEADMMWDHYGDGYYIRKVMTCR